MGLYFLNFLLWCFEMCVGKRVVSVVKSYEYFFFFPKSSHISDISKLKLNVSAQSMLTDT